MKNTPKHSAITAILTLLALGLGAAAPTSKPPDADNLLKNPDFRATNSAHQPTDYDLTGDVEYRYLGDPRRDASGWGIALQSAKPRSADHSGLVSQTVKGIDPRQGRWFRFTFRGLPQDNFYVDQDDLYMQVEYFGDDGRTSFDGKIKKIYPLIQQDRRNLSVNGDRRIGGAAVWRDYQLDFWIPFPQIDQVRLSVGFGHASATRSDSSEFFVTDFSLTRLEDSQVPAEPTTRPGPHIRPEGLLPIGGRWFYQPAPTQSQIPASFDYTNAKQLYYDDGDWSTPFAGNMTAWLRAGDKDSSGNIAVADRFVPDNVTIRFDATSMIITTHGLPNHPTGKFPEAGFGNPNYIQERVATYFIPLDPQVSPRHVITTTNNSNHALPMGPIGIAANGVVFFNPFDMGNTDATNMMDRCCGHPNQDGQYHYHKYPICLNSPWADEGDAHSPLIGFAFDGFPIYGPYESAGVMAKDVKGDNALNGFNLHWDKDRGWHYHVTPGQFPYIIGGYWGTEDSRDSRRPPPGGMRGGNNRNGPGGRGGPNGPGQFGGRGGPPGGFQGPPGPPPDF